MEVVSKYVIIVLKRQCLGKIWLEVKCQEFQMIMISL